MSGTMKPGEPARNASGATTEAGNQARATADKLRDEASGAVADIKAEGAEVAEVAKERASHFAEEQKRAGADQAAGLARAVHHAAEDLEESSPQLARHVHEAASAMDGFARTLRDSSASELMARGEDLARRQPVAFFGAAVLAGFALARFAKSSASEARHGASRYDAGRSMTGRGAIGGGSATPHTAAAGAPGWVPAAGTRTHDDASQTARPATMAAASLGGAAARPATPADGRSPLGDAS
jgi:hypothetical protein